MAIRTARDTVWIANAYFFPGYRLLRDLRRAASRGVRVQLILQSDPDVPIARTAGELLYESLMKDGVQIHEYCRREMHGKVAIVDDIWTTVGSTNLDPLSLSLNLEANVLIRDAEFAATLRRQSATSDRKRLQATEASRAAAADDVALPDGVFGVSHFAWISALVTRAAVFGARIRSFVRGQCIDTKTAFDASARATEP